MTTLAIHQTPGAYFHSHSYIPGEGWGQYVPGSARVVAWTIRFRRTGSVRHKATLQTKTYQGRSLFGALRQLIREGRVWHGKTYFLEVVSCEAKWHAEYQLEDDQDD